MVMLVITGGYHKNSLQSKQMSEKTQPAWLQKGEALQLREVAVVVIPGGFDIRICWDDIQETHNLVGGLEHFLFYHILGIVIPSD